ncbi:MAG TPA: VCBS repeat-containing protein [Thermoanaerobaculia bacterium]
MRKLMPAALLSLACLRCNLLLPGDGPGTASGPSRFAAGTAPGSVEVADLNGDGKPDLVVANEQSQDVTVLLGDGRGGFKAAKGSPFAAGQQPNDIAIGDFNRDGRPDLAFANHEAKHLTVLLGDGRGGFAPARGSPFAVAARPHTHGVATGDLNGDGNLDLLTDSWGNDQVAVLLGDGKGGFKPGPFLMVGKHPYQRVRIADVNGDGKDDVVATNLEGDNVTILLGDGKGGFNSPAGSPFPCGDSPFFAAVGDINGDGKLDLAIVNAPSSTTDRQGRDGVTLLLGDGKGGFKTMAGSTVGTGKIPNRLAIGDVNGDGVADVAVTYTDNDSIALFLMSRKGAAPPVSAIAVGRKPKGIAIHDLNGDGKGDIVVADNGDNDVLVILGR